MGKPVFWSVVVDALASGKARNVGEMLLGFGLPLLLAVSWVLIWRRCLLIQLGFGLSIALDIVVMFLGLLPLAFVFISVPAHA